MSRLLIVDDEINIRELIVKYANNDGFETEEASNGQEALEKLEKTSFDLLIMDIMMPYLDGFSTVKLIRKKSDIPIILLSARSEEYDKIYGFDLGIDDYVTKPFSPKELMLRVHAIINRAKPVSKTFVYKDLKIDFYSRKVFINNESVDLSYKEFELLKCLTNKINGVIPREELIECVWGKDFSSDDRTLDTHMKSLRKKLKEYADCIVTLRRVGYRFETI